MHTIHDIGQTLLAGTIISSDLTGRVKQPSGQRTAKQSKGEFLGKHKAEGGGGEGIEEEDKKKNTRKKKRKEKKKRRAIWQTGCFPRYAADTIGGKVHRPATLWNSTSWRTPKILDW